MKRDKNFKTLSWEHHDGLITVSRLKRGLANKADLQDLQNYILYIWQNDLKHHFEQEEKALIQPVKVIKGSGRFLERFWSEHNTIFGLVKEIENGETNLEQNIKAFTEILENHIRFEEREFFPFIEQHLSKDDLGKIGNYLKNEHHPCCKTWTPEFWK